MRRAAENAERKNSLFGFIVKKRDEKAAGGNRAAIKPPRGDIRLIVLPVLLAAIGVLFVYSASYYSAKVQYGDAFFFAKKQFFGFAAGLLAMFFAVKFDYTKLRKKPFRYVFYFVSAALLALVFVPGVGKSNYGATRWIGIGSFTLQPSEIAKFALVTFCAGYAADNMEKIPTFRGMLPVLAAGGGYCALIIAEPNMSVTVVVAAVTFAMLFLSGAKLKYFLTLAIPALLAVPALIIAEPYRLLRLNAFIDPWSSPKEEGYQLIQSLYALGNGGWFGTGLFKSRQKYRFLPFAESDFILAVIGEETGFFGITLLFAAFAFLIYCGIKTAAQSCDFFSFLLSCGITLTYGLQTLVNALVVSGCIPPTGIPLPLVSSGNTSLIVTMAAFGVLYKISCCNKKAAAFIQ